MQGKRDEEKDGQVLLWQGYHGNVEVVSFPVFATKQIKRLALGGEHSVFLTKDGEVYSCGENKHGQLGTGKLEPDYVYDPVLVSPLSDKNIIDVTCGSSHSSAVSSTGQVYCWGDSSSGQCGTDEPKVTSPCLVQIQSDSQQVCEHGVLGPVNDVFVLQVACGQSHSLALSNENEVWVWGSGPGLGIDGLTKTTKPMRLESLCGRNVLNICCGDNFSVVIIEKSILDEDYPRNRQSISSLGLETKSHKVLPNTCAKCNSEIYSYEETLDTCIINTDHHCDNQQNNDFETSIQSCDGLGNFSVDGQGNVSNNGDKEENIQKQDNIENSDVNKDIQGAEILVSIDDESEKTGQNKENLEIIEEKDDQPHQICSASNNSEKTLQVSSTSSDPAESQSTGETEKLELIPELREKSVKVGRSQSFLDEVQAREYLAKQFDGADVGSTTPKTVMENIWSSLPTTNVLQQVSYIPHHVTTMTSKAISNIRSSVSDKLNFASGQNVEVQKEEISNSDENRRSCDESLLKDEKPALLGDQRSVSLKNFSDNISFDESSGKLDESSFIDKINEYIPGLDSSREDLLDGDVSPTRKSQSIKTVWAKQEQIERRESLPVKSGSVADVQDDTESIVLETEVWAWGKNTKGQLGLGDMIDRTTPTCLKQLNGKHVIKVVAGATHALALTAYSQVYSWGLNLSGQLGHSEDSSKPSRIKLMAGCYVWDIGAGHTYSVFLIDRTGFQPEIHYVGKHPCKDLYVPIYKTSRLTMLTFLKQAGWIRSVVAGGDNCACISCYSFSGHSATVFEFIAIERRFYHHLNKIVSVLLLRLQKSSFYTTLDVYPYKSTLQNLLSAFQKLTTLIGESSTELTRKVWYGENVLKTSFFCSYSKYTSEFKRYSLALGDMIAINGFDYLTKTGSSFFDKAGNIYQRILEEKVEKADHAAIFSQIMHSPLHHIKEYCKLSDKIGGTCHPESDDHNLLVKVSLNWDSLKHTINIEQSNAETTKLFWKDSNHQKLTDALKIPSRRLIRDSKAHPLALEGGGRFSTHVFLLFNDMFVHVYSSTYQVFHLDTLWVEAPSSDNDKQQNNIMIASPEERFTLSAQSPATKAEWLMALNAAINKVISSQKSVNRRGSTERLTPPDIRQATYSFTKHAIYKEAVYTGMWMGGRVHGHGEMKWSDGRAYHGNFKLGFQHGYGKLMIPQDDGTERVQEGNWKDGRLHGLGKVKYSNGDVYEGYFREGERHGHGVYSQGKYTSSTASVYIGEWVADKRQGYGVLDDILKGEKYMGMWTDDYRQGEGLIVTLDGMYFEGNFAHDKLTGFGLMLTDDNSSYEGEFSGITQLQGKGLLTMPMGDQIEGMFNGSWNEGLKVNGTFHKCTSASPKSLEKKSSHSPIVFSKYYGKFSVEASKKWQDLFKSCYNILGYKGQIKSDSASSKAWEVVAVMVSKGKHRYLKAEKIKPRRSCTNFEDLEKIPPYNVGKLTVERYHDITDYLSKAFDVTFHPLGKLMEGLVDVFRASYIGVGAHPRLLYHAVQEVKSYIHHIYKTMLVLFPDLPDNGGPLQIFSESRRSSRESSGSLFQRQVSTEDEDFDVVSAGDLLHPILLPKIYPPLFDLYALYNDKEDEKYWERIQRLNKQGDMALMAYLGIEQKFWLIDENMFRDKSKSLSSLRDHCYLSAVDTLQQISTAFSPKEKLQVIHRTFIEITKSVQGMLGEDYMWCMDELFPIFQYVVVRAKIHHLGAEVHMIEDLMEKYLENGELGIMFTTLQACYFQIHNEKMPSL